MSAIAVVIRPDGRAEDDLDILLAAQAHWGTDGERRWVGDGIAMGHRRRVDTRASRLEDGALEQSSGLVVTADSRLFSLDPPIEPDEAGWGRLIRDLPSPRGLRTLANLNGGFAVAAWDPAHRRLWMVRDHFGQRPLFYTSKGALFAAATDANALLALDWVDDEPDLEYGLAVEIGVVGYLPGRSHFAQVSRVPVAHVVAHTPEGRRQRRYWQPEDDLAEPTGSLEEQVADLRHAVHQAVDLSLDTVLPVGAHVSGGLDSTSHAIIAARTLRSRGDRLVAGFSWSPPVDDRAPIIDVGTGERFGDVDERPRVMEVGRREDFPIVWTDVTAADVDADAAAKPGRQATVTSLHERIVMRNAADLDVGVLLSGWGSDELAAFNGRGQFADLLRHGRLTEFVYEARRRHRVHSGHTLRWLGAAVVKPRFDRRLWSRLPERFAIAFGPESWDLPATEVDRQVMATLFDAADRARRAETSVRDAQVELVRRGHLEARMASWVMLGAKAAVEHRYPALDRNLVRFVLRASPALFFHDGWKRWGFRQAMSGVLPPATSLVRHKDDPALVRDMDRW